MRCWNHKVENFYKDLKKTFSKSRVWLGTERPSTFTFHPRLIFVLRSHNSMPIWCWHKVRNFYKETGKLSKRLFDLRWSFLTTFTKARIHNMWQECKNVAKIFQRGGRGSHFVKQMKLTRLSSRPLCRVYSERSSSPKHTMSYFEQREQDFNCAPMARKCVTRKCVGSWAPKGAAVKNRVENWENSKRTHTYPHTVLPHGSIPTILV